jgi:hypothetical protein
MWSPAFELLLSFIGVALLNCITLLSFYHTIDKCNSELFSKEPKSVAKKTFLNGFGCNDCFNVA